MNTIAAFLSLAFHLAAAPKPSPSVTLPATLEAYSLSIPVSVNGGVPQKFVLNPLIAQSMIRPAGSSEPPVNAHLSATGTTLGTLTFAALSVQMGEAVPPDVVGTLGQDFLKGKALGIDTSNSTVVLWPSGLSKSEAEGWISETPEWMAAAGGRVAVLPLNPARGAQELPVKLHGSSFDGLLSLQENTTAVDPYRAGLGSRGAASTEGYIAVPELRVGGKIVLWPMLTTRPDPWWAVYRADATVGLDLLARRRCVIDFSHDKVYVESFSEDGELSLAITANLGLPVVVTGNRITLQPIPGVATLVDISAVAGSEVLKIGELGTAEILSALRGKRPQDVEVASKLFNLRLSSYDVLVRKPDGTTLTVHINQGG